MARGLKIKKNLVEMSFYFILIRRHMTSLPIREYDLPTCFMNELNYNPVAISFGNTVATSNNIGMMPCYYRTVLVEKFKALEFLLDKVIKGN